MKRRTTNDKPKKTKPEKDEAKSPQDPFDRLIGALLKVKKRKKKPKS